MLFKLANIVLIPLIACAPLIWGAAYGNFVMTTLEFWVWVGLSAGWLLLVMSAWIFVVIKD